MEDTQFIVLMAICFYLCVMFGISIYVKSRVQGVEDFLVAGRRLNTMFTTGTLVATWYGAGTLLTVSDEIKLDGVSAALLDPIGAGLCLIIAGLFFARPLWNEKLLTISDLFAKKYGRQAEVLSGFVMVPTYFGWIAVQFIALSQLLELFLGLPASIGMPIVVLVGTAYTLIGGMWAVTLTDFAQMISLVVGIVIIAGMVLYNLGDNSISSGVLFITSQSQPDELVLFPRDSIQMFMDSLGLLVIGSVGNIPGQDLAQRIFSAKSATVARRSCLLAGVIYLMLGVIPMIMGLAAKHLLPEEVTTAIVPALVAQLGHPVLTVLFVVTILSVVLSTIDSALLSPSAVIAQNIVGPWMPRSTDPLVLNRWSVLVVALLSYITAIMGESAYGLLESAYEMQLIGLFAPMVFALFASHHRESTFIRGVILSCGVWVIYKWMGWVYLLDPVVEPTIFPVPVAMGVTLLAVLYFGISSRMTPLKDP